MIRVRQIDHLVLRTTRLPEMLAFYRDVLGCAVERSLGPEVGLTQLRAGDALIDLVSVDSELGRPGGAAPGPGGRNLDHLCLQIAAMAQDELLGHLDRAGISHGRFETRYGATGFGPSLYIQDPDGNTVELRVEGSAERG